RICIYEPIQNCFAALFIQIWVCPIKAQHLSVVEADHCAHVSCHLVLASVVSPCIAIGHQTERVILKQCQAIALLIPQDNVLTETVISLLEPIAMLIWSDLLPLFDACHAGIASNLFQLLFAT